MSKRPDGEVDVPQTSSTVDAFLDAGFNCFDTARGYLDGKSEPALRECLASRYPRDRYVLTTKLTGYLYKTEPDIRPLFRFVNKMDCRHSIYLDKKIRTV